MSNLPEGCGVFTQSYMEPDYQLPPKYRQTYIFLMIRDPENIFAYWEIAEDTLNKIKGSQLAIRLTWADHQEIIIINDQAQSWYISVKNRGIPIYGELGYISADGTFITLAVSNKLGFAFSPHATLSYNLQSTLDRWQPGVSS
ncbi:MAG: DUF4912 domain-containing protein [Clostridia bacterium]|nr:DUF4912 domain-containing protein [Clostridia bacterium]